MRNLPAGMGILLLLAAGAGLSVAAGDPAVAGRGEPATTFFASASLSFTLGESLAVCEGEFAFVQSTPEPGFARVPLPAGLLASQQSATLARVVLAHSGPANSAPVGLIQLPAPGHHQIRFQMHLPARLEKGFRTATVPPTGAPVCRLQIRTEPGWQLDEGSAPPGYWEGNTRIAAFPASAKPLTLRWRAAPAANEAGLAVQQSHFAYTLRDGELCGRLEIRGTFDESPPPRTLRCGVAPGCVITTVVSPSVRTWTQRGPELRLDLEPNASRDLDLTLLTVTPIDSPDLTLSLALPRLDRARRAEGTLDVTNASPHSIGGCELPVGFVATPTQGSLSKATRRDLSYRFFALEEGASASLSLVQPRPRIRSAVTTRLALDEQEAEIIRDLRLSAELAPTYAAAIRLPADEFIDAVRLIEGEAEIRRPCPGEISLTWNTGLAPGRSAQIAIVTRKSLAWNQGAALFRLESPRLPGESISGRLTLNAVPGLSVRPVRNPRLHPVPATQLPATACAAWDHRDFDALLVEIGMRQAQRSATLVSRIWPSSQGGRMAGELQIDPGGLPLTEVKLIVDGGDPRLLRLHSEQVSETHRDAEAGTVLAVFDPPQSAPFSLPWDMTLPVQPQPADRVSRRARVEAPLLRPSGLSLQAHRVSVFGAPFCSLEFAPEGLEPLPATPGHPSEVPAAELIAVAPEPKLQITCLETGSPVQAPWEIEELKLASQVAAFAPHRHRCQIVLLPIPVPRNLPLILPPQSTVLAASLQGQRVRLLASPAHPGEVLIPLPAGSTRLTLELDYLTLAAPWAGSGEALLMPPTVPEPVVTRKCAWTVRLPLNFEYSDFATNLSSLDSPAILPITLQPLRSLILTGDLLRRQFALASPAATRKFHGNFTPAPVSFRYTHQRQQLWIALLWMLGGIGAFAVFARERPLYHGLFGLLLLTFLPSSGLASPRIFSDGLLLGWLLGGAILASSRLIRKHQRRLPKPAAGLATILLAVLGGCPQHAKSAGLGAPRFNQATHEVQVEGEELHIAATYLTTDALGDRNSLPAILQLRQFDSLTVEGMPFDFDQEEFGLPDSRPLTIAATYRLPLASRMTWKIAPAASSQVIISGLPKDRQVTVNGGLPLARFSGGPVTAALGSAAQIRLAFASIPGPTLPAKAQVQAALGLFPASQRLACDVAFEEPGQGRDCFTLDVPRAFRLIRLSGSQACRAVETATGPDWLQLDVRFNAPRRDRASFRIEWEAPFSAQSGPWRCVLPQPRASTCETSLTLAMVPPLAGNFRSTSPLPAAKPFLPSDWGDAAKVIASVRLPASQTAVSADLRDSPEPSGAHLNQLFLVDLGRNEAYCEARLESSAPWSQTEFLLHPAMSVREVAGESLLDWNQTGHRLEVRRRSPFTSGAGDCYLISLAWDPSACPGEIPYPALTPAAFSVSEAFVAVATGTGFRVLNAPPPGQAESPRLPIPLAEPVRIRARLDATTAPGQAQPRIVPAPAAFEAETVLAVSVAPEGCAMLDVQIGAKPLESSLDSLSIQLPGRSPAIRWTGDHVREARAESISGSDIYTLVFAGPVHQPVSCTGSARVALASAGLRLPIPAVAGASTQSRYLVLPPTGASPWQFQPEGMKEIPPSDLPGERFWPSGVRAFAVTTDSPSLVISREPPVPAPLQDLPTVLDLYLATTLRKNGDASHRAQAWITPPAEDRLEIELPESSIPGVARLNGKPAAMRSLAAPNTFVISLPSGLCRNAPSLLEIEYDTLRESPAPPHARRLEYQLSAPRLGNLPVVQTAWQIDALQARTLRPTDGNVYPLNAADLTTDRAQCLLGLARELKRTLERENPSPGQQSALRNRILTLAGDPALTGREPSLRPEWEEARQLREFAARGPHTAEFGWTFSRPVFIPLPGKSSACFKKLRGDARLQLAAVPQSDPGIFKSWLWFGAALAALAGWDRIVGSKALRRAD